MLQPPSRKTSPLWVDACVGTNAARLQRVHLEPGLSALPGRGKVHLGGVFNHGSIQPPPPWVAPPEELEWARAGAEAGGCG